VQEESKPVRKNRVADVFLWIAVFLLVLQAVQYYMWRSDTPVADVTARRLVDEMWKSLDGSTRRRYSEPAGERLSSVTAEVMAIIAEQQFDVGHVEFFQTTAAYHELVPLGTEAHGGDPILGFSLIGGNKVYINSAYMEQMNDEELGVLVAHELGHHYDRRTDRVGNAFVEQWSTLPFQEFADQFAVQIVGVNAVVRFNERWGIHRMGPF
jgi:Zn-dependent protease with chaperone function